MGTLRTAGEVSCTAAVSIHQPQVISGASTSPYLCQLHLLHLELHLHLLNLQLFHLQLLVCISSCRHCCWGCLHGGLVLRLATAFCCILLVAPAATQEVHAFVMMCREQSCTSWSARVCGGAWHATHELSMCVFIVRRGCTRLMLTTTTVWHQPRNSRARVVQKARPEMRRPSCGMAC